MIEVRVVCKVWGHPDDVSVEHSWGKVRMYDNEESNLVQRDPYTGRHLPLLHNIYFTLLSITYLL